METCSDSDVSPGVWFFPGLHHGTCLETRRYLARFQDEVKDRFSGFYWSPQQAESLAAEGDNFHQRKALDNQVTNEKMR